MLPKLIPVLFLTLALSSSAVRGLPSPHVRDQRSPVSSLSTSRRSSILSRAKNTAKGNNNADNNGNTDDATSLCLDQTLISTASLNDGLQDAEPNTAPSSTSGNNFINVCKGQVLTNGTQIPTGSCNGIPMGSICSKDKMPSIRIQNPKNLDTIDAKKNFTFTLAANNMALGSFTNATGTYFAAPRKVDGNGQYVGHTHCVMQQIQSLSSTELLDTSTFAFFKGINTAPEKDGTISITVDGGLPAGTYRACTITTGANHQALDGPVAQRGHFDDCTIFTVADGGGQPNNSTATKVDDKNKSNNTTTGSGSTKNQTSGDNNKKDSKKDSKKDTNGTETGQKTNTTTKVQSQKTNTTAVGKTDPKSGDKDTTDDTSCDT